MEKLLYWGVEAMNIIELGFRDVVLIMGAMGMATVVLGKLMDWLEQF